MIQDIYPHKLDNHYDINAVPDMDSIVLYFTEEGVLHRLGQYKEYDNYLFFPAVRDFPSDTTDIDEFPFEKDDLTYLFSVDDAHYFLLELQYLSLVIGIRIIVFVAGAEAKQFIPLQNAP